MPSLKTKRIVDKVQRGSAITHPGANFGGDKRSLEGKKKRKAAADSIKMQRKVMRENFSPKARGLRSLGL